MRGKGKLKKANAGTLPAAIPAKQPPVTLPPLASIIDAFGKGEISKVQSAVMIRDWYTRYFTQAFRTFNREQVGAKISPGDWHMKNALELLVSGCMELPPNERRKSFLPLEILLREIVNAWQDAAAPALSALYHWDILKNESERGNIWERHWLSEEEQKQCAAEYDKHWHALHDELNKLSAQLLNANPGELKQTLERIERKVDAVGSDARTAAGASLTTQAAVANMYANNDTPPPLNETARAAIIKLWKDFKEGNLDAQIDGKIGKRTFQSFIDWCGNLKAYTKREKNGDTIIITVNDCLPGGEDQLRKLMHTKSQSKYAAK